ncbi:MAG: MucB/RseB C-terminal domain-containing protein [Gammaproteobacteria bacterium]|nr:MucB/RseB C-terminal domain-containing protein [Gammaproteobacteria bacterium]
MIQHIVIFLLLWNIATHPFAQNLPSSSPEALNWLNKTATAPRQHNYVGTYVYYTDGHLETSRVTHAINQNGEQEKIEILDGLPRIVLRNNNEMKCYLPESKRIVTEKRWLRKIFPDILPQPFSNLDDNYFVKLGKQERVAGYVCQVVLLVPRDHLRYGHKLWIDINTGLLLKAAVIDSTRTIEQFAFAQVEIGGNIDAASLKPNFPTASEWQTTNLITSILKENTLKWQISNPPTGFKKTIEMKRVLSEKATLVDHIALTDGLATVSVFIEPILENTFLPPAPGFYSNQGAINIYVRTIADNKITTVGEVPHATVKAIGDAIYLPESETITETITQ